jgi:phosphoglycerate dehydrogenase-like enzyme
MGRDDCGMVENPEVLLLHRTPPESEGTVSELAEKIQSQIPDIDLVQATDRSDALARLETAEVVIEHGYDERIFQKAPNLAWVQSLSAGHDRYDIEFFKKNNITLTTASGVHAVPAAEHVFGSLLMFERGLDRARQQQSRQEWNRWSPGEMAGKTMGIVGVGAIGSRVAELARAHGLTALGTKRDPTTGGSAVDKMYDPTELHRLLGQSDYVVLTCPLTDETYGLIDQQALESMASTAILVNVARGDVVKQQPLVRALKNGEIGGAVLDVFASEPLPEDSALWNLSNVVITPHLAGGSPRFFERIAELFAKNFTRFTGETEEPLRNQVV